MLGRYAFRPYPETRLLSIDRKRAAFAQQAPRQNHLLAALPPEDYERLLPDLEPVQLPLACTLHPAGDQENHLYFPTAGIVSRIYVMETGASAEFAVTGSEGVIGIAAFLGSESTPSQAVVLSTGYAYRLKANLLKNEFEHGRLLSQLLLRYTLALMAQTGQIAACNQRHSLEQRLCRWILSCLDRLPSNDLTITQELIADMLGVRREGITETAGKLQKAGLIHHSRGHIIISDRPGLEAHACECYAVIKREYDRLLALQDTIGDAGGHGTCRQYRTGW